MFTERITKKLVAIKTQCGHFLDDRRVHRQIQELESGVFLCRYCGKTLDRSQYPALALLKCPHCNELIFVPLAVGKWWAIEPLAAGGFGSVYLGRSRTNPEEEVIVKVLRQSETTNPEDEESFRREYEVARNFGSHPNLARALDYGVTEGLQYMVTEYARGERMSQYIGITRQRIPAEECLYYLLDLSNALDHILSKGYLHRDIKPENVIIGTDGFARLIDYGSCITEAEAQSAPVALIGSPHYLSPERYRKMGEDVRSDIYSLGMLAFFALEGVPYAAQAETVRQVAGTHLRELRLPLVTKMSGIHPDVVAMIGQMIEPLRDNRLQSYDEVREQVYCILAGFHQEPPADNRIQARRDRFIATYGHIVIEG